MCVLYFTLFGVGELLGGVVRCGQGDNVVCVAENCLLHHAFWVRLMLQLRLVPLIFILGDFE